MATITPKPNASYRVTGPLRITKMDGALVRELKEGETVGLCRCGHSATKPFCDGSHVKAGFQAE